MQSLSKGVHSTVGSVFVARAVTHAAVTNEATPVESAWEEKNEGEEIDGQGIDVRSPAGAMPS